MSAAVSRSAQDLRALARDVEPEQPELAHELRGIALHREAFERAVGAAAHRLPRWTARLRAWARRAALALWRGLERHGRRRAYRDVSALAERRAASDPALAATLREAARTLAP